MEAVKENSNALKFTFDQGLKEQTSEICMEAGS